jgi:hypothetical protein
MTYFYGGVIFSNVTFNKLNSSDFHNKWGNLPQVVDNSIKSPIADRHGKIWLGGTTTLPADPVASLTNPIAGSESNWKSWLSLGIATLIMFFLARRNDKPGKRGR